MVEADEVKKKVTLDLDTKGVLKAIETLNKKLDDLVSKKRTVQLNIDVNETVTTTQKGGRKIAAGARPEYVDDTERGSITTSVVRDKKGRFKAGPSFYTNPEDEMLKASKIRAVSANYKKTLNDLAKGYNLEHKMNNMADKANMKEFEDKAKEFNMIRRFQGAESKSMKQYVEKMVSQFNMLRKFGRVEEKSRLSEEQEKERLEELAVDLKWQFHEALQAELESDRNLRIKHQNALALAELKERRKEQRKRDKRDKEEKVENRGILDHLEGIFRFWLRWRPGTGFYGGMQGFDVAEKIGSIISWVKGKVSESAGSEGPGVGDVVDTVSRTGGKKGKGAKGGGKSGGKKGGTTKGSTGGAPPKATASTKLGASMKGLGAATGSLGKVIGAMVTTISSTLSAVIASIVSVITTIVTTITTAITGAISAITSILTSLGIAAGVAATIATFGVALLILAAILVIVAVLAVFLIAIWLIVKFLSFIWRTIKNSQPAQYLREMVAGPIESLVAFLAYFLIKFYKWFYGPDGIVSKIKDFVGMDTEDQIKVLWDAWGDFCRYVARRVTAFKEWWTGFCNSVAREWNTLKSNFITALTNIRNFWNDKVKPAILGLWEDFKTKALEKWEELKTKVGEKIEALKTKITEVPEKVIAVLQGVWSKFQDVKDIVNDLKDNALSWLESKLNNLITLFTTFKDKLTEAATTAIDWLGRVLTPVKEFISDMLTRLKEVLINLPYADEVLGALGDALDSLWNAMDSKEGGGSSTTTSNKAKSGGSEVSSPFSVTVVAAANKFRDIVVDAGTKFKNKIGVETADKSWERSSDAPSEAPAGTG